jgi:hypothetical protein
MSRPSVGLSEVKQSLRELSPFSHSMIWFQLWVIRDAKKGTDAFSTGSPRNMDWLP